MKFLASSNEMSYQEEWKILHYINFFKNFKNKKVQEKISCPSHFVKNNRIGTLIFHIIIDLGTSTFGQLNINLSTANPKRVIYIHIIHIFKLQ